MAIPRSAPSGMLAIEDPVKPTDLPLCSQDRDREHHKQKAQKQHSGHQHNVSYHSSSNSESNIDSPRLSDGECSSSTPTSIDDGATPSQQQKQIHNINDKRVPLIENGVKTLSIDPLQSNVDYFNSKDNQDKDQRTIREAPTKTNKETINEHTNAKAELPKQRDVDGKVIEETVGRTEILPAVTNKKEQEATNDDNGGNESVLDNDSLVHTDSYIQDLNDDHILLNKKVSRVSTRRSRTQETVRKSIPFHASKHSQILPMEESDRIGQSRRRSSTMMKNNSMTSLPTRIPKERSGHLGKLTSASYISLPPMIQPVSPGLVKRSESATAEIKKMRVSLLHKREMRKKRKSFLLDDDRVLIGNKVSEGHVNFIIAYNMLTGIRVAVSRCSGIMKPLTPTDFRFTKKLAFDYHGNELTPSSQYAFKFKDYSPEVFRELRALFGLDPADYLVSLTSKYILSELNSPGKSGSFFYFSRDYKYIIKTIHHAEHLHLRKHLHEYYTHVKENPDTLICQFYGLHRVKMPISFQNKIKHRKIYFLVMNNLFPPHLEMHTTFDLKGSTWGRMTHVDPELAKNDDSYRPVLKDLNWLDQHERIKFGPLKKKKFLEQLQKDVKFLAKLNTMDYSLLLGIHDLNKAKEDELRSEEIFSLDGQQVPLSNSTGGRRSITETPGGGMNFGSVIPHYFKEFEGGIRSSDPFNNDTDLVYYVGIIDCLTNYSLIKKLETFWRGLSHDLKVVSAIPPKDYADRFYEFVAESVDALPPKRYKDDPDIQNYRD